MPVQPRVKAFLAFLQKNPSVRQQIRAAPHRTLLYAGHFIRPMWQDIADMKRSSPQAADKETLPDVLARITLQDQPFPSLLAWAKDLDQLEPWSENGFIAWRALSGIFASNATGAVSFQVGSGVDRSKVFTVTELAVLSRNPRVDAMTRDMLAYFERCIRSKEPGINFGFLSG
jgi:hypothetical protein